MTHRLFSTLPLLLAGSLGFCQASGAQSLPVIVTVQVDQPKNISPDLFGIFFEDLNYAADGGLYAELVQNRSFEYQATEQPNWTPMTAWEPVSREGAQGSLKISDAVPVHPNNPHYVVVETKSAGGGFGLANSGFDGIPVKSGEQYDFSVFARQLFTGNHWGGDGVLHSLSRLVVRLENRDRGLLGETVVDISGRDWQRLAATISPTNSDTSARLVLLSQTKGAVALDEISLFPHATFRNHPNGLRADLAQAIADIHPKFMRFPGGCLVHGHGLGNMYHWKDSIGPVEQRRGQEDLWGYHQSLGLGFFEYFQFCEDIGAKALPVVAAGVCCQNADDQGGSGQRGLPMEVMPAYNQDVLDLIEWANGPVDSKWGAKRAAAGHPASFNLQYLGVGNEDHITPVFQERFKMIYDAVKAKHPEITIIGTVGPSPEGEDYDAGWKIADEYHVDMVDEHYYESPDWFFKNMGRYDSYDRAKSKVYVGEYAAHEKDRASTLRSALAEAAYMTSLERNGDVVHMASYAPLLANRQHVQWRPDMIYFNNTGITLTPNYYVQELFGQNQGDKYLPTAITAGGSGLNEPGEKFAASGVRDSQTGDLIIKLVNAGAAALQAQVKLSGITHLPSEATRITLSGGANAVIPVSQTMAVGNTFKCDLPESSFTLIRIKTR